MPCLERILAREAGVAPLATVNILMSLCQLRCLPFRALHFVFSPGFINHVSGAQTWGAGCVLEGRGAGESGVRIFTPVSLLLLSPQEPLMP